MFLSSILRPIQAVTMGMAVGVLAMSVLAFAMPAQALEAATMHQLPPAPADPPDAPAQVPPPPPPPPSSSPPAATDITGGLWLWLRTERSDDTVIVSQDPSKYTISLMPDGRLAIRADCNRGSGSYTLNGPQITLTPGAMTLAACPPGSQDKVFLDDLKNVATYVMDGENLVLNLRVDSGNMIFQPQPPTSLTGNPWRVQSYNNGRGGLTTVLGGAELTATFGEDGSVSGDTGCNLYRGSYTIVGSSLTLSQLVSTRRACLQPELNEQEQAFLRALEATASYELVGDRLTLRNAAGTNQIVLVRPSIQPVPGNQTTPAPGGAAPASDEAPAVGDAGEANSEPVERVEDSEPPTMP